MRNRQDTGQDDYEYGMPQTQDTGDIHVMQTMNVPKEIFVRSAGQRDSNPHMSVRSAAFGMISESRGESPNQSLLRMRGEMAMSIDSNQVN